MLKNRNETLKRVGRNQMKILNQRSASAVRSDENPGQSDGGVIGRYKKSVRASIKGGK
jgi:hypothetical protein